jgi:ubiquinone/menaquinone biosynthesis C-methylase UbiE
MGFYDRVILPRLCDLAMRDKNLEPYRRRVINAAEGRVLEIGVGSGLNLKLYQPGVSEVLALEPDSKLIAMARNNAKDASRPITFLEASAEQLPLDDNSVDTVVTTWTLCTIPDGIHALQEARRVLKPSGKLLFAEHGLSPEQNVQKWQNRINPLWKPLAGGCHLNLPIKNMIETAGFAIDHIKNSYAPGPKCMGYMYEGSARVN